MFAKEKDKVKSSPQRPVAPRLAANATSTFGKTPTAPRLKTTAYTTSPSSSPATRRPLSIANGSPTARSVASDRNATPLKASAIDNITPRSSARRSKLSGADSTPRAMGEELDSKPTPDSVSRTPSVGESFFRANDAPPQSPPRRPVLSKQTSSFIYANDSRNEIKPVLETVKDHQPLVLGEGQPVSPASLVDKSESATAATYFTPPTSRPTSSVSAPVGMHVMNSISPRAPRAPSPTKQNIHLSYRKGASQIIRPEDSRQNFHAMSIHHGPHTGSDSRRRQSSLDTISEPIEAGIQINSAPSEESPDATFQAMQSPLPVSDAQNFASPSSPTKSGISGEFEVSRFRASSVSSQSFPGARLSSPIEEERNVSQSESQQSMAAKARQERKVLDLEISNSSLLAINRSLEREIRRQKVELRRFRRLSRNPHRSSWLSDPASSAEMDERDEYSEPGHEDEDQSADELDGLSEEESFSEEAMSPSALAEHDARHFAKDEERLRLDLSKHKELLVDSQKMNSSLRRCLGITEQLIKDGGRALEYQVTVADVQLGGRVLSPEELEMKPEWEAEADSYFMSNWAKDSDRLSAASQRLLLESDFGTDKDSGVDLEYGKRTQDLTEREQDSATLQRVGRYIRGEGQKAEPLEDFRPGDMVESDIRPADV